MQKFQMLLTLDTGLAPSYIYTEGNLYPQYKQGKNKMSYLRKSLPDLIVPSGSSVSNMLKADAQYSDAYATTIYSPAGLEAGAHGIEVSQDGVTFFSLRQDSPLVATLIGTAGQAITLFTLGSCGYFRIKMAGNAGADRTFKVDAQYEAGI